MERWLAGITDPKQKGQATPWGTAHRSLAGSVGGTSEAGQQSEHHTCGLYDFWGTGAALGGGLGAGGWACEPRCQRWSGCGLQTVLLHLGELFLPPGVISPSVSTRAHMAELRDRQ